MICNGLVQRMVKPDFKSDLYIRLNRKDLQVNGENLGQYFSYFKMLALAQYLIVSLVVRLNGNAEMYYLFVISLEKMVMSLHLEGCISPL